MSAIVAKFLAVLAVANLVAFFADWPIQAANTLLLLVAAAVLYDESR